MWLYWKWCFVFPTETAMGIQMNAQEENQSEYVTAVYEWVQTRATSLCYTTLSGSVDGILQKEVVHFSVMNILCLNLRLCIMNCFWGIWWVLFELHKVGLCWTDRGKNYVNSPTFGADPNTKFHQNVLSNCGDETWRWTDRHDLPITLSFYTSHADNTFKRRKKSNNSMTHYQCAGKTFWSSLQMSHIQSEWLIFSDID
jgi:hypothetical protein